MRWGPLMCSSCYQSIATLQVWCRRPTALSAVSLRLQLVLATCDGLFKYMVGGSRLYSCHQTMCPSRVRACKLYPSCLHRSQDACAGFNGKGEEIWTGRVTCVCRVPQQVLGISPQHAAGGAPGVRRSGAGQAARGAGHLRGAEKPDNVPGTQGG